MNEKFYGVDTHYALQVASSNKKALKALFNAVKRTNTSSAEEFLIMKEDEAEYFKNNDVDLVDIMYLPFSVKEKQRHQELQHIVENFIDQREAQKEHDPIPYVNTEKVDKDTIPAEIRNMVKSDNEKYVFELDEALRPIKLAK